MWIPSMRSSGRSAPASSGSSSPTRPPPTCRPGSWRSSRNTPRSSASPPASASPGRPALDPDETLAHDILAVTREALSNCARHARATAVTISLARQDDLITLDITDNGRGLGTPTRSSGLASMRHRAEPNGGTLRITTPAAAAPDLAWTARPTA